MKMPWHITYSILEMRSAKPSIESCSVQSTRQPRVWLTNPMLTRRQLTWRLRWGWNWRRSAAGLLRDADDIGLGAVVERLSYLEERFGRRFVPCDELLRRAEAGESFDGACL